MRKTEGLVIVIKPDITRERRIDIIPKEHVWDVRHVEDTSLYAEILTVARDILRNISQEELDEKGAKNSN